MVALNNMYSITYSLIHFDTLNPKSKTLKMGPKPYKRTSSLTLDQKGNNKPCIIPCKQFHLTGKSDIAAQLAAR
jgi:hypothetical protein